MAERLAIAVLFGGRSVEHEVSVRSARSMLRALEPARHHVLPVAIDPGGRWFTAANPLRVRDAAAPEGERRTVLLPPEPGTGLRIGEGDRAERRDIDLFFPLIHGAGGEDGALQGLFELAEVAYAGCGVAASALAMDKALAKSMFRAAGLPVLEARAIGAADWRQGRGRVLSSLADWTREPVFVKPANGGSSVGVTRATDSPGVAGALDEAFRYDLTALVERALEAREIEVSVLGNDSVAASVPGEIIPARAFYDYEAKYLDDRTRLLVPAPLPPPGAEEVGQLAVGAFRAIGGSGFARVDFLVEGASGRAYVSEINTLPGFTDVSMFPRLWQASGLPYPALLDRIIGLGLERHAARRSLVRALPRPQRERMV